MAEDHTQNSFVFATSREVTSMLIFSKMKLWDLTNIRQQFSDMFET